MHKLPVWGLAAALAGCIVVGTPFRVPEKRPFRDEIVEFIEIGTTTRDQVRTQLGRRVRQDEREPPIQGPEEYRQGEWWAFSATRAMWQWWLCVGTQTAADCGISERGEREYRLLIKFDDNDVVADYDVLEDRSCSEKVCFDGGEVMVFASTAAEDRVRSGHIPHGQCAIYVYADLPIEVAEGGMQAWLDDVPMGSIVNSVGYFRWLVRPGQHTVKTRYIRLAAQQVANVSCDAGGSIYLHSANLNVTFNQVGQSEGQAAIVKRRLVLDRAPLSGSKD